MELKEIAEDNIHGSETLSIELVRACLEKFKEGRDFSDDIEYIKNKKNEMVQLINIIEIISEFKSENQFYKLLQDMRESIERSIKNTRGIIKGNIVTISWSKLVQESIILNRDKIDEINILESRPMNEGSRFAEILYDLGFNVKLYIDASIYHAIKNESIVVVGMDALLPDLSLVNKVGTYSLALGSRNKGSKFYSIGTKYKISKNFYKFINHPFNEIYKKNINTQNYYFDITDPTLVNGYIMDFGIFENASFKLLRDIVNNLRYNLFKEI